MKVKLIPGGHKIVEEGEEYDFFYSPKVYDRLKILKDLQAKNWDVIIGVTGVRGSGKSTLGMQTARLLDGNFTIVNVCSGLSNAARKIGTLPPGSSILLDEGSLVLSSKDATTKAQKNLLKLIDVCRQRRLAIIVLLPSIFDLNKGIVEKFRCLLHTYTNDKLDRGYAVYFGQSQVPKLYYLGKDTRSYRKPSALFSFKFSEYQVLGAEYQALKGESLQEIIDLNLDGEESKADPKKDKKEAVNHLVSFLTYVRERETKPSTQVAADYLGVDVSTINGKIAKKRGQNARISRFNSNNPTDQTGIADTHLVDEETDGSESNR